MVLAKNSDISLRAQLLWQRDLMQLKATSKFAFKLIKRSESATGGCRQEVLPRDWISKEFLPWMLSWISKKCRAQ